MEVLELLKHEEELSLAYEVQRMLTLRRTRSELEAQLGRPPALRELADGSMATLSAQHSIGRAF